MLHDEPSTLSLQEEIESWHIHGYKVNMGKYLTKKGRIK